MRIPTQKGSSGTRPSTIRTLPYNCERCRRDKTKCDKTWPKCRRCVRKGYKCVCVATKRGRPSKSSKINANARMLVPNKRKRTLGPEFFLNMQMQTLSSLEAPVPALTTVPHWPQGVWMPWIFCIPPHPWSCWRSKPGKQRRIRILWE